MGVCLKLILVLLLTSLLLRSSEGRRPTTKRQLKEFVCRTCWMRLYRHCHYSIGLTKRSVSDSEQELAGLDSDRYFRAPVYSGAAGYSESSSQHRLVRRQAPKNRPKRRTRHRRRFYRVKVNCTICNRMCFN